MKPLTLDYSNMLAHVTEKDLEAAIAGQRTRLEGLLDPPAAQSEMLGWVNVDGCTGAALVSRITETAREIRENAEVFLLIGVGGSNQGARAVIKALQPDGIPEILYAGNNLSPRYLERILAQIRGRSVYANVIAKNFATLEPGICFRIIRQFMEAAYGKEAAAARIIATGSPDGSSLERLASAKGYRFLPFPPDVGGRFSVLSAVGLLPIAVSGVPIQELLQGARDMARLLKTQPLTENIAVRYGVARNLLLAKRFRLEILAYFEPLLKYFAKWWVQLFGESEGKDGTGIFPAACSFSEDLHALGQYIQDGRKMIFETFINLEEPGARLPIPADHGTADGFDYLDGKDFTDLNKIAFEATVRAHVAGGVPALILNVPALTPYYLGQLFYFFEYACYISATILGVNPFDQPGVEAYKTHMFSQLKRKNNP
ncbi:glucose-6-phosphate isomerase [Hydrogenispora ethanolica]|uniref:Glucose-6-phosphate isomerase n=1 Tax=Hydrogenispora ethanolica TaxID=1082276 RepID=A0A4R1RNA8_HYDET|nr:glucose-6-phosphate isomerase [Hydrogenispora ethanolica]TCL67390.1 glucose-6-phosphate isomerase [Hydrogenispora ethanolica]